MKTNMLITGDAGVPAVSRVADFLVIYCYII